MAVISDSSPLILYSKIGRLDLFRELFAEILIPPGVRQEIVSMGASRPGAQELTAASWIKVQAPTTPVKLRTLLARLGPGEADVIALATELGENALVLLDDADGRRFARDQGIALLGSAGALVLAKERGAIPQVRPLLDTLRAAGLYLSDAAYRDVLMLANEWP